MHADSITPGQKILFVDDVLATGGTARAGCQLIQKAGGIIAGCAFIIELSALNGRHELPYEIHSLITY
jgi:adenine phosphoribosyltransferase